MGRAPGTVRCLAHMPKQSTLSTKDYDTGEDGLPRELVGSWVRDKHLRLRHYIAATKEVRRGWLGPRKAGATYIDLFCGPGRARVRDTATGIDGSPVVAWRESVASGAPFSVLHIADKQPQLVDAAQQRLRTTDGPVQVEVGEAIESVQRIAAKLDPRGLHFAFLDPYSLAALPFEVLRHLAAFERMDILIHVSAQDLQRNLGRYIKSKFCPLDSFAPNWRKGIDPTRPGQIVRGQVFQHWTALLGSLVSRAVEVVRADDKNQRLYWLALAARHPLAHKIWESMSNIEPQRRLRLPP